jgi:L-threonine-O-3-phosphate decarboxylase
VNQPTHGGNLLWAATIAGCSPNALLDFSASINPLGMPESAQKALQAALPTLIAYPDPQYTELKRSIGQHHDLSPDWILPGNGAAELLTWACRDLADQKCTYLIAPGFADYDRALRAANVNVKRCVLDTPDQPMLSASGLPRTLTVEQAIAQSNGILINNPHNPTGQLVTAQDLKAHVLDNPHYSLVVVDEAFMDFLPPGQQQSLIGLIAEYPQLVILRSLTKFYAIPGLRLGYAIAHPDRLRRWNRWRDPWTVNTLAARVGEVVLQDTAFQAQTYAWLAEAQPKLAQGLANLPGLTVYPGCVNFLLVRSQHSVAKVQQQLLQDHHLYIRDCRSFPELGDGFFRVAVRTVAENDRLLSGLAAVLQQF